MERKATCHPNVLTVMEAAEEEVVVEAVEVVSVSNVVKRDTCLGNFLIVMPVVELQSMSNIFPISGKSDLESNDEQN